MKMRRTKIGSRTETLTVAAALTAAWALTGCGAPADQTVTAKGETVDRTSEALATGLLQWANGTYGASCQSNASGSWSLALTGGSPMMDHSALAVTQKDPNCALTLTQLVTNESSKTTYVPITGSPAASILLGGSYQGSPVEFSTSSMSPVKFYANAFMNPSDFSANFTVTVAYSDDPKSVSGTIMASYSTVTASGSPSQLAAPDYSLDLSGLSFTTDASASNFVESVSGNVVLDYHSVSGTTYWIDTTDALGASPSFATIDAAYGAGTSVTAAMNVTITPTLAALGFTAGSTATPVSRSIVVQRLATNGVKAYEQLRITFNPA